MAYKDFSGEWPGMEKILIICTRKGRARISIFTSQYFSYYNCKKRCDMSQTDKFCGALWPWVIIVSKHSRIWTNNNYECMYKWVNERMTVSPNEPLSINKDSNVLVSIKIHYPF